MTDATLPTTDLPDLSPTARSTIKRNKHRAVTDRNALYSTMDAALICHLSTVINGAPVVLPTLHGRIDNTLYLHGSTGALSLRTAAEGVEVCVAATVVDGVVYARSVFHNSMNYRSAVIHGTAHLVTDPDEKLRALEAVTEHAAPGSWAYARQPNAKELAGTAVLRLDLTESAVKMRTGDPVDEDEDLSMTAWAGVLPVRQVWGEPVTAADLRAGADGVPAHVSGRR